MSFNTIFQKDTYVEENRQEIRHKKHNAVNVIYPYRTKFGHWAYDDEYVTAEPFVMGSSELIDMLVREDCNKFTAYISAKPLPTAGDVINCVLDNIDDSMDEELAGIKGWYQLRGTDHKHWLCGHIGDFFHPAYPKSIFVNIKK